ncbi:AfsR/SARP family transcriptional regulator [Rhodococcus spelaei]|uniref:AfsR/SARP family transcriptional regulator n=1 Tax=Rhodococcus spelaei TaxID=2546320 RepID=A0A541AZD7_9NOCA|nr:BTAD domain-containing putative transcriptional regulator [Rhodococcus spelaei]TQF65438.1 AfsR/SARP family transcriptional regulator [Rhodococcus spelaei]
MPDGLELRVLGPVAAVRDGHQIELGGARQRSLLGALVLAHPHSVSAERLLGQVWHDLAEPKLSSLHVAISKLRDALSPDRARRTDGVLVREGNRYLLAVERERVDAARFEALVQRGADAPADGAVDRYREALALWRGSAYADIAGAEFAAPEIARLSALRLEARKSLLAVELSRGRFAEVATDAEAVVAEYPLDERAWELFVLALYRTGRQSDALAALRRVRAILDDELGIDPGIGLRELEVAVLAQDEALHAVGESVRPEIPRASQLPVPRTRFVGRGADIDTVTALLDDRPLVTLVGPGGVGKTRLAVEVCRSRVDADGPWWVDLGALTDGALLVPAVAAALGLPGVGTVEHLAGVLSSRTTLLILDNCEHVVAETAQAVGALLDRCPQVRVLATSREPLDVDGEELHEVSPLGPDAALDLFAVRAGGVVPGWTLGDTNSDAVRTICRELDGIPLGIELAAAQLRVLSEQQIADGLGDRFTLLQGGSRSTPARQRALADTVDWSYRLLDAEQSELLRRVAVFAESFDISGAAAVGGVASTVAAVAPLTALVRRSLVVVQPGTSPRRYRMLLTIRHFALDRAEPGERAQTEAAHRAHVLARVNAAHPSLYGTRSAVTMRELSGDQAEHRAALVSALAVGDAHYALELSGGLYWFWYRMGRIGEGLGFLTAALDAVAADGRAAEPRLRARALSGVASLTYLTGDRAGAAQAARCAADAWEDSGDGAEASRLTAWLGYFLSMDDAHAEGLGIATRAAERARELGSDFAEADARMVLGMVLRTEGRPIEARTELAIAIAIAERIGNRWAVASSTWAMMKSAMDVGDLDGAMSSARDMQSVLEIDGDVTSWLVLIHTAAAVLARAGHPAEAAVLAGAVQAQGSRIGFLPEWMDPVDGPREAVAIRDALTDEDYRRHTAVGADLGRAQVDALLSDLVEQWVQSSS